MNRYSGSFYINSQFPPKINRQSYILPEQINRVPRRFSHFLTNLTLFYINAQSKQANIYPRHFIHFLYNFSFFQNHRLNPITKGEKK